MLLAALVTARLAPVNNNTNAHGGRQRPAPLLAHSPKIPGTHRWPSAPLRPAPPQFWNTNFGTDLDNMAKVGIRLVNNVATTGTSQGPTVRIDDIELRGIPTEVSTRGRGVYTSDSCAELRWGH